MRSKATLERVTSQCAGLGSTGPTWIGCGRVGCEAVAERNGQMRRIEVLVRQVQMCVADEQELVGLSAVVGSLNQST